MKKNRNIIKDLTSKTLGILGGGQLGKMLAMSASNLGIRTCIYDPNINSPAFQNTDTYLNDSYDNIKTLKKFINICDVITYEFENIPLESIRFLNKHNKIFPGINPLKYSQDRYLEKKFISKLNIEVAPFYKIDNINNLKLSIEKIGGKGILKTRRMGYDGKGQVIIQNTKLPKYNISFKKNKYLLEGIIEFEKEISIIAVRSKQGKVTCFEPSENYHKLGILRESKFPANITNSNKIRAKKIATKIANALNVIGLIAIEMFLCKDNKLIVNEIAPRPHNSGHWTIDACNISQFEALVRTVFDLPLPKIKYLNNCKMVNVLGENFNQITKSLYKSNHVIHIYGKDKLEPLRKMGHINILN